MTEKAPFRLPQPKSGRGVRNAAEASFAEEKRQLAAASRTPKRRVPGH